MNVVVAVAVAALSPALICRHDVYRNNFNFSVFVRFSEKDFR